MNKLLDILLSQANVVQELNKNEEPFLIKKEEQAINKLLIENMKEENIAENKEVDANPLEIIRLINEEESKTENTTVSITEESIDSENVEVVNETTYITEPSELFVEILKNALFENYTRDPSFELWFEHLKEIINEAANYDLLPKKIKVKRENIKIITENLQRQASIATENFKLFDDYLLDIEEEIKQETDQSTARDLIYTISTNLATPLLLINTKNIKSEEAEIIYESLKVDLVNILYTFMQKYLEKTINT